MTRYVVVLLSYLPAMVFAQSALDAWYGKWSGTYTGGDSGTCSVSITFSTMTEAAVSGTCKSDLEPLTQSVSGKVSSSGNVALTAGSTSTGAKFTGTLHGTSGSGHWDNPYLRTERNMDHIQAACAIPRVGFGRHHRYQRHDNHQDHVQGP